MVLALGMASVQPCIFAQAAAVDPGFAPTCDSRVTQILIQSDRRILICGAFSMVNGQSRPFLARLTPDGRLDESFAAAPNGYVSSIAFSPGGKIVFKGLFTSLGGVPRAGLARLHADGSLDEEFIPPANSSRYYDIAVQPDGKVLFLQDRELIRLNANGTRDTNFVVKAGFFEEIVTVLTEASGHLLIGGMFTEVNGQPTRHVARLDAAGSVDPGFNAYGQNLGTRVSEIAPLADGSIYIGGSLLARLDNRGRLDPAFQIFRSNIQIIYALAAQEDLKPVCGINYDFEPLHFIGRFETNGIVDMTFKQGMGANAVVYCITIQEDGKLLIGGDFTSFNGIPTPYIVRLFGDRPTLTQALVDTTHQRLTWPLPYSNFVLQAASLLPSTNWIAVSGTPLVVSNACIVTNTITSSNQLFRLVKP